VCSPFYSTSCSPSHSPSYSPSHSPSYSPSHFSPSVSLLYYRLRLDAVIPDFRLVGVTLYCKEEYVYVHISTFLSAENHGHPLHEDKTISKQSIAKQFIYAFILANSNDFYFLVDLVVSSKYYEKCARNLV
jgi:hypothetical protein